MGCYFQLRPGPCWGPIWIRGGLCDLKPLMVGYLPAADLWGNKVRIDTTLEIVFFAKKTEFSKFDRPSRQRCTDGLRYAGSHRNALVCWRRRFHSRTPRKIAGVSFGCRLYSTANEYFGRVVFRRDLNLSRRWTMLIRPGIARPIPMKYPGRISRPFRRGRNIPR